MFEPVDGHVDASGVTHAYAKSARHYGTRVFNEAPVEKNWGAWTLEYRPDFTAAEADPARDSARHVMPVLLSVRMNSDQQGAMLRATLARSLWVGIHSDSDKCRAESPTCNIESRLKPLPSRRRTNRERSSLLHCFVCRNARRSNVGAASAAIP